MRKCLLPFVNVGRGGGVGNIERLWTVKPEREGKQREFSSAVLAWKNRDALVLNVAKIQANAS